MHHPHTTQLFAKINTVLEFFKDEQQVSSANFTSLGNVAAGGGGSLPVGGVVSVGVGVGVGGTGQSEIGNLLQVKDGTVVESFLIEVLIVLDYLRFEKEVEMSGGRVKGKDPRPKLELGGSPRWATLPLGGVAPSPSAASFPLGWGSAWEGPGRAR